MTAERARENNGKRETRVREKLKPVRKNRVTLCTCYPHSLSNGDISNPIPSSLTTHPTQQPHLRYTNLILMLALNRPTLRTIQHHWSDCCPIELSSMRNNTNKYIFFSTHFF
ncbi:hypothetical protein MTR_6g079600 [Medicago truncatula]|uniref:Uncharacterized protein n=1 Tax=Medicago truncatula TaxID=3880 RepID=A0A072UM72_MEDTR|nr:hypothetical protein MTR_6g079600 [Medicago truncatula]